MTIRPLADMQQQLADIRAAVRQYEAALKERRKGFRYQSHHAAGSREHYGGAAVGVNAALDLLVPVMAMLAGVDVADAEPVAPIMQGYFSLSHAGGVCTVHSATGHTLSTHPTRADADAEVARLVSKAREWSTEEILRREA